MESKELRMPDVKNVLFLCTGNSARSILAEAVLNDISINKGQFKGFSAGSQPTGEVNALAIEELENRHLSTSGLRSKSWNEFTGADAPVLDFVITANSGASWTAIPAEAGH
jgi:arsenate reductase